MKLRSFLVLLGLGIAIGGLYIPVLQRRVISYGVDTYSAHRPIFQHRTSSQTITTENKTVGIGAILVDMRRSKKVSDVLVQITDTTTGELLATSTISKDVIRDDEFAYTSFQDTPIHTHRDITIQFSAQEATNQNPIGLRFDPANGTAAITLTEKVPLWKFIRTEIQNKSTSWSYIIFAIGASLVVASSAFLPLPKKSYIVIIGLFAIAAFTTRILIIPQLGGVSGGDPYNYLYTSQAINEFKNPFANTKRLPGYPLLLAPFTGRITLNDQHIMRYVQITANILGIIMVACIARALKLSWPTALATSAIFAFQKDNFFTSLRPEPYTLYTALFLTTLFLFFTLYEKKRLWLYILFGIVLGYSAMVRQEGFVVAALLGMSSIIYEGYLLYHDRSKAALKTFVQRFTAMYLPALIIVLPFFIHNSITYGHPLYTEYFEGERLQIVDSFRAFQNSSGATWGVIGSMWKISWDSLERLSLTTPLFLVSVVALWAWYGSLRLLKHTPYTIYIAIFTSIIWISLIAITIYMKSSVIGNVTIITAAWILAGIPIFFIETKWRGLVVFLALVSQILIATWFHPFPKHYQQSYPLIVLIIATALVSQLPTNKKIVTATTLATVTLPFFIVAVLLYTKLNAEIDRYNASTALDSVTYRAARAARTMPTPIGFDQAYLPARLYFDPNAKYFPDEDNPTPQMEQDWLQNTPLKTMVVTNGNNVFKKIPDSWIKIQEFRAEGRKERMFTSTIYAIP